MRYCEAEAAALKGLKHSTKIVALMLAARTSDNTPDWPGRYVSFPSIPTLMNDTGLQKRALYYAINELVEAKVVRIYKDRHPGARWDHNVYEWTATDSPNYHPDWKKTYDTQQEAVGARLTNEGWDHCRTHNIGPNITAEQCPEFVLPAKKPILIDALDTIDPADTSTTEDDEADTLPIDTPTTKRPARKSIKKRAAPIPDGWSPSEKALVRTRERYPSIPLDAEIERFTNYHAAKGSKMVNWDAAWGNWCLKGNEIAKEAWMRPISPQITQGAPAINPSTGKTVTRDDFGYACLDAGIDPNLYINYWKPYMGLPSDPGWPEWAARIDRFCGRA